MLRRLHPNQPESFAFTEANLRLEDIRYGQARVAKAHVRCRGNNLFIGDKGMLICGFGNPTLLPEEKFKDFKPPEPWIEPSRGHHQEWIDAAKTGAPTLCNFDYSGKLIEHNLLGTVAFRVGKKLQWDPKSMKATNCPEADQFIRREYREGWVLDG